MRYYLFWSNKEGQHSFDTHDIKQLQDPLKQIYELHKSRKNGTSKPKVICGNTMKVTPVIKKGKVVKFQIEET